MGLCLPRRMPATWLASRPRTLPSASTTHQRRWMSVSLGVYVFIRTPAHDLRAFSGTAFYDTGLRPHCQVRPRPLRVRPPGRRPGSPQEGFEEPGPGGVAQPGERLLLDLPDAFPRDAEQRADLLEGHRLQAVQAEVEAEDAGLALLEGAEGLLDGGGEGAVVGLVVGPGGELVRQVVEEPVVLARRDGGVEREVGLGDREGALDLLVGELELVGDLLDGGFAAELLEQDGGPPADAVEGAGAVEGDADDAALLREGLEDGLADPPHGVGDELDALGLVELPGGADETEVPLVD